MQSDKPGTNGKHYYYRPKDGHRLSLETIRQHLNGQLTIALYAINPRTQRSKWVAIDADYENSLEDLLKLQWELRQDGVESALEKSRRGGHLWIFADQPLLARDCRIYIYNLARRLRVPVKGGAGLAEGIEVFPRQDELRADEFGNAIRGPLGVHRATGKRYWFYGADYSLEAQLEYLSALRKITEEEMTRFVVGLTMPEEFQPQVKSKFCHLTIPTAASFASSITSGRCDAGRGITGPSVHHAHSRAATEVGTTWLFV